MRAPAPNELGPLRSFVAAIGSGIIALLIRVFGREVFEREAPWLVGPLGGDFIGDKPYEECAQREGLALERRAARGGLVPDFEVLRCGAFDVSRVDPKVRHFYENTARYRMDLWAKSWFPANVGLWLLVTTISRKVNQLNFPLGALESAQGTDSEILLLKDERGAVRYAGWYRRLVSTGRAIYCGFYMTERVPRREGACVKVVFPMPNGNATVILAPSLDSQGRFCLSSSGQGFGDVGFYRVQRIDAARLRVWRVATLKEDFCVFTDAQGTLRCDHGVRFLGMRVLQLHYRLEAQRESPTSGQDVAAALATP